MHSFNHFIRWRSDLGQTIGRNSCDLPPSVYFLVQFISVAFQQPKISYSTRWCHAMISFVRLIILVFFRLTKMQPKSDGEHEIIDSTSLSCVISHANFQFWKIRRFHSISEPMSISALLTPNNTNVVIISSSNCRLRSGPRR